MTVRRTQREDLPQMEWFGMFTDHREILHDVYDRQENGEQIMLVADLNGAPVGQVWIDLVKRADEDAGLLWAVRVFPWLQGHGIGAHLLHAAERAIRRAGYRYAELGVEKDNTRARRFYERHGYTVTGEVQESYSYTTPDGRPYTIPLDEWMMRKPVARPLTATPRPPLAGDYDPAPLIA